MLINPYPDPLMKDDEIITSLINESVREHTRMIESLGYLIEKLVPVCIKMMNILKNHGTVFWLGNGGSAADAQHMAAELINRFKKERKALSSLALTTDTSVLTSIANDYDFTRIFSRQLEGLCRPQDMVIGLSTSGNSENVILALKTAQQIGAYTVAFTGKSGGLLAGIADICIDLPSENTARIQEGHSLLCHILCEVMDQVNWSD